MSSSSPLSGSFFARPRLPVQLQTEAGECGLVCLAMIANYWGHKVDPTSLRRRHSISVKGATLKTLIAISRSMELQARPVKTDIGGLGHLKLPCVLHWDMVHFVVLKRVSRGTVVVHDPAVGQRRLALAEVSKHFTGVALELTPTANFRPTEDRLQFSLASLMGHVVGLKRSVGQLVLLGIALQVCALAAPFYLQWIVDEALVSADRDLVTVLGIAFLLLVLMQTVIGSVRSWVTTVFATNLNFQWLGNAFVHLMKLPCAYFEKRHLGDIISRFGSIQTIQNALTTQFIEAIIDGFLVIGTLVVMTLYSGQLTAVACVFVLGYLVLRWTLFQRLRDATREQIIHAAKQHTHFIESTRGVQTIRLFGRENERRIGWMNALADQFNAQLRVSRLSISYQTANGLLFGVERVVVIWLAALAVLDTRMSVGMVFAFISYMDQFSARTAALIDRGFEFGMLRLQGERVADILLTEPEDPGELRQFDSNAQNLDIEMRGVAFRYAEGEPYVLKNLDLYIPAGQCIAITGASGCGKTTLIKLLLGLLDPTEGEVLFGGVPLRRFGLGTYRALVATVMQDDMLFAGSIADNISFFDSNQDQNRIASCARLAAIDDEIQRMPMKYHTLVGDIGSGISGGQKQRLILARALYKNPKILVLDEATSHLDVSNEQLVNSAIRQFGLTRIIVAHRPETINVAQRVVVVDEGRVVRDLSEPSSVAAQ